VTILADNIRRAAHGKHRCGWCQRPIAARERYRDVRQAEDGTVYTWREHLACAAFMHRHADPFDWPIEYPVEAYNEMVEMHGDPLSESPTTDGGAA
jgi:hypothetical protein